MYLCKLLASQGYIVRTRFRERKQERGREERKKRRGIIFIVVEVGAGVPLMITRFRAPSPPPHKLVKVAHSCHPST